MLLRCGRGRNNHEIETYGETNEVISAYLASMHQKNNSDDTSFPIKPVQDSLSDSRDTAESRDTMNGEAEIDGDR